MMLIYNVFGRHVGVKRESNVRVSAGWYSVQT